MQERGITNPTNDIKKFTADFVQRLESLPLTEEISIRDRSFYDSSGNLIATVPDRGWRTHGSEGDHVPYDRRFGHPPDFLVEYNILSKEEGGRKRPPLPGIRWDFWYEHPEHASNQLFMIWPEFYNEMLSDVLVGDQDVPLTGIAAMWIANSAQRTYHKDKIYVGMPAWAKEGPNTVAEYRVIRISGLLSNPVDQQR